MWFPRKIVDTDGDLFGLNWFVEYEDVYGGNKHSLGAIEGAADSSANEAHYMVLGLTHQTAVKLATLLNEMTNSLDETMLGGYEDE